MGFVRRMIVVGSTICLFALAWTFSLIGMFNCWDEAVVV